MDNKILIVKANLFANNNNSLTKEVKEVKEAKTMQKIEYVKNGYFKHYTILYNNKNLLEIGKDFDKTIKSIKMVRKEYCNSCRLRITNKIKKSMDFKLFIKNLGIMGDPDFKILLKYLKTNKILDKLLNVEFYTLDLAIFPEFKGRFVDNKTFKIDIYLIPLDYKYNFNDSVIIEKLLLKCINKEATLPDAITLDNNNIIETKFLKLEKEGITIELPSFIEGYQKTLKDKEAEYNNTIQLKLY